ncbi:class I SAM-dependent methyltransferase [Candidatus Woesearchaeota archaeon]|nr:class I SAM-dependent methyltransferase [Candidatus Woesearchaeota archaeon]MBW3006275.1 class I SAM-dependent methyltransferase [Candidatus Woesearchaeota archaeon]
MKSENKPDRYEEFYKNDWAEVYGFWHKIITRGEHQVKMLEDVLSKIDREIVNMLDVGCGQGDEVKEALTRVPHAQVQIIANDTSAEALVWYTENILSLRAQNRPARVGYVRDRLENLPKRPLLAGTFDFILFSHCLYSADINGLFNKYTKLLQDDGQMLIFLDSEKSGLKKLQKQFWDRVHGVSFDENTAETVIEELNKQNISYDAVPFSNFMDLDKLQKIDAEGITKLLLPFAFRTQDLDRAVVEDAVAYVKTLEKDRMIENSTYAIKIKKN